MDRDRAYARLAEACRSDELTTTGLAERLAVVGTFDPDLLARLGRGGGGARPAVYCGSRRARVAGGDAVGRAPDRHARAHAGARRPRTRSREVRRAVHRTTTARCSECSSVRARSTGPVDDRDEDELLASLDVCAGRQGGRPRQARATVDIEPTGRRSRAGWHCSTSRVRFASSSRPAASDASASWPCARVPEGAARWTGLSDEPAMMVYGIGGVGEVDAGRALRHGSVEEESTAGSPRHGRIDLDRPTLSSYEPKVVLADVIRQVAAQFPDQGRALERSEVIERQRRARLGARGRGLRRPDPPMRERASEFTPTMRSVRRRLTGSRRRRLRGSGARQTPGPGRGSLYVTCSRSWPPELPGFRLIVSGRCPASPFSQRG